MSLIVDAIYERDFHCGGNLYSYVHIPILFRLAVRNLQLSGVILRSFFIDHVGLLMAVMYFLKDQPGFLVFLFPSFHFCLPTYLAFNSMSLSCSWNKGTDTNGKPA